MINSTSSEFYPTGCGVLVIGDAGFIGAHLVRRLVAAGARIWPSADLDRVYAILREVGLRQQATDPDILEPAEVMGLQGFDGAAPIVRVVIKSRPARHGAVGRAYRKLVKEAFAREGIATQPYQVIRLRADERMQEVAA